MTLFDEAIRFAAEKHSGMLRKQEGIPYILHPMEVAVIVGTLTGDEEVLAAAVLHDTVEDTDTTPEELLRRFGPRVAALVASETERAHPELPRSESWRVRKEESLEALKNAPDPAVRMIWLGDKLSNMRSFHGAWAAEGSGLWARFNQKDPAQQAWYYRALDALFADMEDSFARQEFHALVETVFGDIP